MGREKTFTRGDVIVEEIEVGDIHYEFEYGCCIKSEVISKPQMVDEMWEWKSRNLNTGETVNYGVNPKYSHYGPKLYTYEAYSGCKFI